MGRCYISSVRECEVKSGDILNAYAQASVTENVLNTAVIVRSWYGLKSAGAAFRSHHSKCMESLGYFSFKTDLDLWLAQETRPEDGVQHCSYLLCYVDDILVSITMQMMYFSDYISSSLSIWILAIQTCTLVWSCTRLGYIMEYGHGQ